MSKKKVFPSQFSCVHVSCDVESDKYRGRGGGVPCEIQMAFFFHISQHKGIYLSTVVELHWSVYEKPDECRVKETACTFLVNQCRRHGSYFKIIDFSSFIRISLHYII